MGFRVAAGVDRRFCPTPGERISRRIARPSRHVRLGDANSRGTAIDAAMDT